MPYLSLSNSRNRATLIAALLIMEFLAILWLKDSRPSQSQPHAQQLLQQQQRKQGQDTSDQQLVQGKKIRSSKAKAASPRFLNGGAGVAPYHINDEQWDFSMRVVRPEHRRSEGSENRKASEKKLSSSKTDHDNDQNGRRDSMKPPPPPSPPFQSPHPIDNPVPPMTNKQNQPQQEPTAPSLVPLQGHQHHRAKTPDPHPSIGGAGSNSTSEQQKGEAKEKIILPKEPVKSKGNSNITPDIPSSPKDSQGSIKTTKDERTGKVSSNREATAPTTITNKKVKGNNKLSKKQRQQRQQQRQQRVEEKNQRGRFKSTEERKLAQLIPALDEYGVVIEDHFISPRDSDGDGVPDYYVLLRPSSSIDTTATDIGLFEDEVVKAPLPSPLPKPPVQPIAPTPSAPSAELTVTVKNEPVQASRSSSAQPTNMPTTPSPPSSLS